METVEIKDIWADLPRWTVEDYDKAFKTQDLCVESYNEERLYEDENDYIEDLDLYDNKDVPGVVESSKEVHVYEKDRFKLDAERLKEQICEYAYDNYYSEDYDNVAGLELVDDFVKKFNSKQHWYTSGKPVAVLDMSEQVKEYYLESADIPKEKWEETYNEWVKEYNEDMERIRKEVASGVN